MNGNNKRTVRNINKITHKNFLWNENFLFFFIEEKYIPIIAKQKAINFEIVNFSSGYIINAIETGIITDILLATVLMDIPTFCIP